jgi:Kinetochore complex Fta4 of Sim4 subunit, or CENP-50
LHRKFIYSNKTRSLDRLPEELSSSEEYTELYKTLRSLAEHRRDLVQKLETLQVLKEKLGPLEDPQTSVQPNLIGRDSSLNEDLAKTKRLGLRAAAQAASAKNRGTSDLGELSLGGNESAKLRAALRSTG